MKPEIGEHGYRVKLDGSEACRKIATKTWPMCKRAGNLGVIIVIVSRVANYILPAAIVAAFSASSAAGYSGENLSSGAKITMEQAIAIAQKARPGTITDKELEREKGGSGLRYSFDVTSGDRTYEVGVDAVTGSVLENGAEGANPD